MNISILGFISAEHEDKRKIKSTRIGEFSLNGFESFGRK